MGAENNPYTTGSKYASGGLNDAGPDGSAYLSRQESLDVGALFSGLWRRKLLILAVALGLFVPAALIVMGLPQEYEAQASILLDIRDPEADSIFRDETAVAPEEEAVDTQVEIIASSAIAQAVIDLLDLSRDPEFASPSGGGLGGALSSLLPGSGSAAINGFGDDPDALKNVVLTEFRKRTEVTRKGSTYVVLVSFRSEDRTKASRIANAIASAYLDGQLQAQSALKNKTTDRLEERLAGLRNEVSEAEIAVEEYRSGNNLVSASGRLLNEQNLSELNARLVAAESDLAARELRLQQITRLARSGTGLEAVPESLQSDIIRDLRQQQALVIRKRAELLSRYRETHPAVLEVDNELEYVNRQISDELQRIVASQQTEVVVARQRVEQLRQTLEQATQETNRNQRALVQLRQLEREAEASRALYGQFLEQFKQRSEGRTLSDTDARLMSEAIPPLEAAGPSRSVALFVAGVFCLVMGMGAAFIAEQFVKGFRNYDQAEKLLGLPVLAVVPRMSGSRAKVAGRGRRQRFHLYMLKRPFSGFADAFRTLDVSLLLANDDARPETLLFTSSLPGEGKSTSALCYASSMAAMNVSCVLIDADLRDPSIAELMDLPPEQPGLVDVLNGTADLNNALVRDPNSGLAVLTRGSAVENPAHVLGSEAFDDLLESLTRRFGLVVLDSAPLLPVADTRLLACKVDSSVMVMHWEETTRDQASQAVDLLRTARVHIAGLLVTQVRLKGRFGKNQNYGDVRYNQSQYGRASRSYEADVLGSAGAA